MPKLSTKIGGAEEATDPTGCYLHIIKPDGLGGYDSFAISLTNLTSLIQVAVDAVEVIAGTKTTYLNQSASFQIDCPAGMKVMAIDIIHVTGTVDFQIGTTVGGEDIIPNYSITEGNESFSIGKLYIDPKTIYVTRNSGTFNLIIHMIEDYV